MVFLKHVLGTLLLTLPILRSVSTSSGYVGGSSDMIVASKCSDGRPKWCNKMQIKFPDTLARKCETNGSKVQIEFCCETCKVLNSVTTEVATTTTDEVQCWRSSYCRSVTGRNTPVSVDIFRKFTPFWG